jgi:hypothetical protein
MASARPSSTWPAPCGRVLPPRHAVIHAQPARRLPSGQSGLKHADVDAGWLSLGP